VGGAGTGRRRCRCVALDRAWREVVFSASWGRPTSIAPVAARRSGLCWPLPEQPQTLHRAARRWIALPHQGAASCTRPLHARRCYRSPLSPGSGCSTARGQAGRAERPAQGVRPTQARVHDCLADLIDALMLRLDAGTKVDKSSTLSDPAPSGRTRGHLTERAQWAPPSWPGPAVGGPALERCGTGLAPSRLFARSRLAPLPRGVYVASGGGASRKQGRTTGCARWRSQTLRSTSEQAHRDWVVSTLSTGCGFRRGTQP